MSKPIVQYLYLLWVMMSRLADCFSRCLISIVCLELSMDAVRVTSGVSKATNAKVS